MSLSSELLSVGLGNGSISFRLYGEELPEGRGCLSGQGDGVPRRAGAFTGPLCSSTEGPEPLSPQGCGFVWASGDLSDCIFLKISGNFRLNRLVRESGKAPSACGTELNCLKSRGWGADVSV